MLFNSWLFPPFLIVVLILYRVLPDRYQNTMLLAASYFFYACGIGASSDYCFSRPLAIGYSQEP